MVDCLVCIRIKESLDKEWSQWFDGLVITLEDNGNTLLQGALPDQPALRGVLCKV